MTLYWYEHRMVIRNLCFRNVLSVLSMYMFLSSGDPTPEDSNADLLIVTISSFEYNCKVSIYIILLTIYLRQNEWLNEWINDRALTCRYLLVLAIRSSDSYTETHVALDLCVFTLWQKTLSLVSYSLCIQFKPSNF